MAISRQLLLSLNTQQTTFSVVCSVGNPLECGSVIRFIMAMTSRNADERAMYSASVVLSAMRGCILEPQRIGHPA